MVWPVYPFNPYANGPEEKIEHAVGALHTALQLKQEPGRYSILSAIRDFFSISGARATHEQARRVYQVLGASENLSMVEVDDGHGHSKPRRMVAYRWFGRWLKGVDDQAPEPEVLMATEEELHRFGTGVDRARQRNGLVAEPAAGRRNGPEQTEAVGLAGPGGLSGGDSKAGPQLEQRRAAEGLGEVRKQYAESAQAFDMAKAALDIAQRRSDEPMAVRYRHLIGP